MKRLPKDKWEEIKMEYITSNIGYRELSAKNGISVSSLAPKAKREKWSELRAKYRADATRKSIQKIASRRAQKREDRLFKLQDAADGMGEVLLKIVNDVEQFRRHIVTEGLGGGATKIEERIFDKYDTKAIKDLTGAMRDLAIVLRNVYDIPTESEKQTMDIASARLLLEQAKADAGNNTDKTVVVRFDDGAGVLAE